MLEDVSQDGQEVDKNALFLQANGGVNEKGRSWGFGTSVKCHSSTSSSTTSSCKSKFTPHLTIEDNKLKTRLHVIEEENGRLKSKMNVMEDHLASVLSMLEQVTGAKANSSSRPPNDSDDRGLSDENDGEDSGDDDQSYFQASQNYVDYDDILLCLVLCYL